MSKVLDDRNKVIYEGSYEYCERFVYLMDCDPSEVTEEDEVIYGEHLKTSFTGKLLVDIPRPRRNINIKFYGIDSWNRPVFKSENGNYLGSTTSLFPDKDKAPNNTAKEISDYFRNNIHEIEYFGKTFDCEPMGGLNPLVDLVIID